MPKKKKKQTSLAKRKKYIREKYYNVYIRLRDADCFGYCTCVTCGKRLRWNGGQMHAGHFIHGLDFIDDNQHCQCNECNTFHSGRREIYTLWMIDKYGRERVDELIRMKSTVTYSREELQEISDKYRKLVQELKRDLTQGENYEEILLDRPSDGKDTPSVRTERGRDEEWESCGLSGHESEVEIPSEGEERQSNSNE